MINYKTLENRIGYRFVNQSLITAALTHSSIRPTGKDFDRLEFLGDRVLELVISEILYKNFPKDQEGDLAKRLAALVCRKACETVAHKLELQNFISVMGPELNSRSAVLSDSVESLLGAMYLDGGLSPCQKFILEWWQGFQDPPPSPPKDAKTSLQEWAQSSNKANPFYELLETLGPDHAPTFKIQVIIKDFEPVIGKGISKRQAEQNAAYNFLQKLSCSIV